MPAGAVYVGRPNRWGNPFRVGQYHGPLGGLKRPITTIEQAVEMYRHNVMHPMGGHVFRETVRRELAGKDLVCWCPLDRPCHADILLKIANGSAP